MRAIFTSYYDRLSGTHDVHEGHDVVFDALLPVHAHHRVVDDQLHLQVPFPACGSTPPSRSWVCCQGRRFPCVYEGGR